MEGLMLKLKLHYFGHLMRRADSLEKILMLGGIGGRRRRGQQRIKWLDGITNSMDMGWVDSRRPGMLQSMVWQSQTRLSNLTELRHMKILHVICDLPDENTSQIYLPFQLVFSVTLV